MNKSFNIGVLFMDEAMSGLTHDYFANILNSFKVTAESKGYDITFINSSRKTKKEKTYLEHCRYRGLDGVVIACINYENPEVIELLESDIPVVTVDHKHHGRVAVLSNNYVGMRELVEYIISMGHKKIAYITGDENSVTKQRLESFRKTMESYGLDIPQQYLVSSEYRNLKKAEKYTKQLLNLPDPPTCIMYSDDYSALGGIGQIHAMGKNIPQDISVAGFDDIFIAGQLRPRLTTVCQDTDKIGRKAAEKLISLIEKKTVSLRPVIVDTELRKGASVRKLQEGEG